jgi:hypothetical protein
MNQPEKKPPQKPLQGDVHGEGDPEAARRFNESQKRFVDAGRVPEAAERAAPESSEQAAELERAEKRGRERAKEEDPTVRGANAPARR